MAVHFVELIMWKMPTSIKGPMQPFLSPYCNCFPFKWRGKKVYIFLAKNNF